MTASLTHQQIFDKAVLGVVRQGALSKYDSRDTCRYRLTRGAQTLACGVGQLIDDANYNAAVEGCGVRYAGPFAKGPSARLYRALASSGVDLSDAKTGDLLAGIQRTHDYANSLADFIEEAANLAREFALTFPDLSAQRSGTASPKQDRKST